LFRALEEVPEGVWEVGKRFIPVGAVSRPPLRGKKFEADGCGNRRDDVDPGDFGGHEC